MATTTGNVAIYQKNQKKICVLALKLFASHRHRRRYLFQIINFDSPRGGISLVTEKGVLTTSRLLVQKAITQDSGLYTCTPSNANPSTVRVHIVDGE